MEEEELFLGSLLISRDQGRLGYVELALVENKLSMTDLRGAAQAP